MADNSLDDFFAKKDKGKKKNKSKFTASDILAKQNEEPKKPPPEKKKKEKEKPSQPVDGKTSASDQPVEEEEWEEFEVKETDYSGLRIQNLQISEKEDDDLNKDNEDGRENEEGEGGEKREGGPWNKANVVTTATPEVPSQPQPQVEAPPVAKTPGKYIPPGARQAALEPVHHRKKNVSLDIKSEDDFPTLGGGPRQKLQDSASYEKVRSGGRQMGDPSAQRTQIELENKFSALRD